MPAQIVQGLRYDARGLRRNRTFTAVAVLSLGLGIGVTTSVFSMVDRILFRSLPFADKQPAGVVGHSGSSPALRFLFRRRLFEAQAVSAGSLEAVTSWTGSPIAT
jgi:putative ABC transport system permease protein